MNQDTSKMAIAEPEALQLACELDTKAQALGCPLDRFSAVLRLQHTRIAEPEAQLYAIGAGGVGESIKPKVQADTAQEPVAWRVRPFDYGIGHEGVDALTTRKEQCEMWERKGWKVEPLYAAHNPARQPLTDEQIALISVECAASHKHDDIHFARAIEEAVANQPPRQPLTDEQILSIVEAAPALDTAEAEFLHIARAIEAAHGITGGQK